jgi:protein-disulfide isomerase-like protein with CxxC motif
VVDEVDGKRMAIPLHGGSLLVFLSTTCSSCRRLAEELDRTTAPVVACIVGDPGTTNEVQAAVPRDVPVISGASAQQIRTDLNVQTFPTAVVQRDGLIVAIGQGSGADSADDLDHLWRQRISASTEARK